MQNYFIFQPVFKYFKTLANGDRITVWKSEGFPEKKSIKPPIKLDNSLHYLDNHKVQVKFDGSCLK